MTKNPSDVRHFYQTYSHDFPHPWYTAAPNRSLFVLRFKMIFHFLFGWRGLVVSHFRCLHPFLVLTLFRRHEAKWNETDRALVIRTSRIKHNRYIILMHPQIWGWSTPKIFWPQQTMFWVCTLGTLCVTPNFMWPFPRWETCAQSSWVPRISGNEIGVIDDTIRPGLFLMR